jgi:hypothetical protein
MPSLRRAGYCAEGTTNKNRHCEELRVIVQKARRTNAVIANGCGLLCRRYDEQKPVLWEQRVIVQGATNKSHHAGSSRGVCAGRDEAISQSPGTSIQ